MFQSATSLTISAKPLEVGAACQCWVLKGDNLGLPTRHRGDGTRFISGIGIRVSQLCFTGTTI
ncbi:MAG: hypothetical protein DME76_19910 [Verrucomicrobia bacterium]|nr:MAG: hypothetical protein DME76_19910 [Verrucomicrobiota bacterium]